jgi:5-methylcytosine-specific restriction protein A
MIRTLKRVATHVHSKIREAAKRNPKLAKALKHSVRSSKWATVERGFLKANPYCAACGGKDKLQVHHIQPFHLHPELELDPGNLVVLCMSGDLDCHLKLGHGGSFRCYNPDVVRDCWVLRLSPGSFKVIVARAKDKRMTN